MPAPSESKDKRKLDKRKLTSKNNPSPTVTAWPDLSKLVLKSSARQGLRKILPGVDSLAWGLRAADASDQTCTLVAQLATLALSAKPSQDPPHWPTAAETLQDTVREATVSPLGAAVAIAWAYALPELTESLGDTLWWRTLEELQVLSQTARDQTQVDSWQRLMLAGELTAILALRLPDLPSCVALGKLSKDSYEEWGRCKEASVTTAFHRGGTFSRLILASTARQALLLGHQKKKLKKFQQDTMRWIGEGICVSMRPDGSRLLGPSQASPEDESLLTVTAKLCDNKSVIKARKRAIAKDRIVLKQTEEVELPDAFVDEPNANFTAWRADWGRQHGRFAVDYSNGHVRLEIGGGRSSILCGAWDATVSIDGTPVRPNGDWEQTCWFTDDEVHYLEMTRYYENDIEIHRQFLLLREDDLVLLGDVVNTPSGGKIDYVSRIGLGTGMAVRKEQETRELVVMDAKKDRAIVMPLGLPEWRVARAPGTFEGTSEHLELTMHGTARLEASMLIMVNPHRFPAQRTWRQLTVGENLQPVPRHVAVSYRFQIGNDQFVMYRTLAEPASRTFLGQNIASEFYVGRFDPTEGAADELVSVETE